MLGDDSALLARPIYAEANQLSLEFLSDPRAYLKGSTMPADKTCIFLLSETITLCDCHPDLELFGCQGNPAGDDLHTAANWCQTGTSRNAHPSLGDFILRNKAIYGPGDISC